YSSMARIRISCRVITSALTSTGHRQWAMEIMVYGSFLELVTPSAVLPVEREMLSHKTRLVALRFTIPTIQSRAMSWVLMCAATWALGIWSLGVSSSQTITSLGARRLVQVTSSLQIKIAES